MSLGLSETPKTGFVATRPISCSNFLSAEKKEEEAPPAKLLDDLFRKTKATPCIYWLPLTEAKVSLDDFYAPNFEKVEGAYCFGLVRRCVHYKFKIGF